MLLNDHDAVLLSMGFQGSFMNTFTGIPEGILCKFKSVFKAQETGSKVLIAILGGRNHKTHTALHT